ncbi:MAG: hypothetical protein KME35_21280 [Aphanocapsa sp. GSE-SYN-MK-11-07L]|nr:hypothetical protein [Aphanocapsa sp. GSE-SYN-MK-11-07L]
MLGNPANLKVKQGDGIQRGQVISDRTSSRTQLEQQRQAICLKLEHLNSVLNTPVSHAVEQAKVRHAQLKVRQQSPSSNSFS